MTYLANNTPLPTAAPVVRGAALLSRLRKWWQMKSERRASGYLAALSDQELHDLGFQRDWVSPQRPPELGALWLHRTAA